ncbi:pulmonary surfactant-associated protein C [Bufo gargarizans]|uniref:pulmonary surfactant-associated protein C n=1 Tax=Bufo gargarizans TaxID=30331 RepID=UPI001CF22579|nr:pulmonary surfactant-associated protein C [Bufo gargarizans]
MEQSKTVLMDTPPVYSELLPMPRIPCLGGVKKLLCVVLVVVVLVVVLIAVLLMGLHMSQKHTETIFQMSLHDGTDAKLRSSGVATFHLDTGINTSASVVYDYSKLLICTRPRPGHACYITRMEPEHIQSLQNIAENVLSKVGSEAVKQNDLEKLASDPSILGTTIRVLCGDLPVYWT